VRVVALDPGSIFAPPDTSPVSATLSSGVDLDGLVVDAFGLSAPTTTREAVSQDDPNDPSTASFSTTVAIAAGGSDAFSIFWDTSVLGAGTHRGFVAIGTAEAPAVLRLPLEVTVP
jgi:hypothetical protein